jgi:hypothetical protein
LRAVRAGRPSRHRSRFSFQRALHDLRSLLRRPRRPPEALERAHTTPV